mmetsp:Transcript_11104/g.28883  ORF Transcript_11104/g.28883 Transcript_11104/m.28883 type:complete len:335 (+) Transcript_11104:26-1030(+)
MPSASARIPRPGLLDPDSPGGTRARGALVVADAYAEGFWGAPRAFSADEASAGRRNVLACSQTIRASSAAASDIRDREHALRSIVNSIARADTNSISRTTIQEISRLFPPRAPAPMAAQPGRRTEATVALSLIGGPAAASSPPRLTREERQRVATLAAAAEGDVPPPTPPELPSASEERWHVPRCSPAASRRSISASPGRRHASASPARSVSFAPSTAHVHVGGADFDLAQLDPGRRQSGAARTSGSAHVDKQLVRAHDTRNGAARTHVGMTSLPGIAAAAGSGWVGVFTPRWPSLRRPARDSNSPARASPTHRPHHSRQQSPVPGCHHQHHHR